jgi:hypothetical protein
MVDDINWTIMGDFNLIRRQGNKNKPRGSIEEMFLFKEALSVLVLTEIPLQGKKYTWSNMQTPPLLEKLDWICTSNSWTVIYPNTTIKGLTREPSYHCPCLVTISTSIPKRKLFRFENYLIEFDDFHNLIQEAWNTSAPQADSAKNISAKFKALRQKIKS